MRSVLLLFITVRSASKGIFTVTGVVTALSGSSKAPVYKGLENWLGGLDSNQDSQIQSLESYQLDDLPAVANTELTSCHGLKFWVKSVDYRN